MAGFKYEAVDVSSGRSRRGVLEADNARQARGKLRERGMIPLSVTPLSGEPASEGKRFFPSRGLPHAQLSLATRQFSVLLEAGLTVEQALTALIEQAESERLCHVLAAVRGEVLAGQSLARAMECQGQAFPELYRTLIDAGEQSGRLGHVLRRLADHLEARHALRQKVGLALIYPVIITVVAVAVVLGLLTYVVPQVVHVFQETRQTLPWLTRALLALSGSLRDYGAYLLAALAVGAFGLRMLLRRPVWRFRFHAWLLRLPAAGRLVRGVNTARLASTLAILVSGGVPLLRALHAGTGVVGNLPMREAVGQAARLVREGGSLSRALGQGKVFPPLFIHLIASGEASGRLEQMLERAAAQQSQELETRAAVLTGILEPALILAMGGVVLVIVLAILLPIFEMNQLVR